jgi:hypothetical protein
MCRFSFPSFASKKFPGTSLFRHEASANQPIQEKSTMAATSSNEGYVVPIVGTGVKNAAKSSGMSERKRAATLSPQKPRISSNLDGRRGGLGHTVRNKPDVAAGATSVSDHPPATGKKTRSGAEGAKEASGATTAPDGVSGCRDKIPKSHVGRSGRVRATSPVRTRALRLSTSHRRADSDESVGDVSSKCKEAGGAQDIIFHNTNVDEEEDEDEMMRMKPS